MIGPGLQRVRSLMGAVLAALFAADTLNGHMPPWFGVPFVAGLTIKACVDWRESHAARTGTPA